MEQFEFNYTSRRKVPKRSHVGVWQGSGDLEVLLEPANDAEASALIRT